MYTYIKQIDSDPLAVNAIRFWAGENSPVTHVQNSENFVYRFWMGKPEHEYYLRLTHNAHRTYEQVLAELEFVQYLKHAGCDVSCPMKSLRNRLVESLADKDVQFYACVFEAAPGKRMDDSIETWSQSLLQAWGRSLGTIHALSKRFHPLNVRRLRWDEDDVLLNAHTHLPIQETAARAEMEKVLNWLQTQSEDEACFGLIHGDLCCANFHYDGRHVISFDFDDSVYHWFVYDLVCALAPLCFHPQRQLYRQWLIEGYQQVSPLPTAWEEEFNWFLRLRGLYLFILNLRNWEASLEEHPKSNFLKVLRRSFEHPMCW